MTTVGIVGLGLIGGSIGLDLMAQGDRVIGVSRRQSTCDRAVERGAAAIASSDLASLAEADLIVLCPPIGLIPTLMAELQPLIPASTVVTDVGSVKASIVNAIAPAYPNFVGGHPMAGTAEVGIEAAQHNLFVDRPYVITPALNNPPTAIAAVKTLATQLGARIYECDPSAHDQAVAWISHLPVMVSSSLIQACLQEPEAGVQILVRSLASSGFRDTSRVGGGNPELGRMMAEYNTPALLTALQTYQAELQRCIDAIAAQDWIQVETLLQQSQAARPEFVDPS